MPVRSFRSKVCSWLFFCFICSCKFTQKNADWSDIGTYTSLFDLAQKHFWNLCDNILRPYLESNKLIRGLQKGIVFTRKSYVLIESNIWFVINKNRFLNNAVYFKQWWVWYCHSKIIAEILLYSTMSSNAVLWWRIHDFPNWKRMCMPTKGGI